jgi:hypothetical protein
MNVVKESICCHPAAITRAAQNVSPIRVTNAFRLAETASKIRQFVQENGSDINCSISRDKGLLANQIHAEALDVFGPERVQDSIATNSIHTVVTRELAKPSNKSLNSIPSEKWIHDPQCPARISALLSDANCSNDTFQGLPFAII